MSTPCKDYLGGGVYAEYDDDEVVLTVESGGVALHRIFLEPPVVAALAAFVMRAAHARRTAVEQAEADDAAVEQAQVAAGGTPR